MSVPQRSINRPVLTAIDVLNRYQNRDSLEETVHVLKYIFPRQFGLHNVFTSHAGRETTLPFTDYSAREDEIARLENQKQIRNPRLKLNSTCAEGHRAEFPPKVPKRLRGEAVALVRQMRNRHKRCSYLHLLNYYCPEEVCLRLCILRLMLTCLGYWSLVSRACQLPKQWTAIVDDRAVDNPATGCSRTNSRRGTPDEPTARHSSPKTQTHPHRPRYSPFVGVRFLPSSAPKADPCRAPG